MPGHQEKVSRKESVQPTRGFLSRWFGSDKFSPEMEEGIRIARKEIPNLAPVKPYGPVSRFLMPSSLGYVSPGSSIYLNSKTNQGQTPQDIADTLIHEQEHVNQQKTSGYGPTIELLRRFVKPDLPYYQRPDEMAAFQAEKERRFRMNRPQAALPSFSGSWYVPQDIDLPSPQKRITTPK